MLRGEGCITYVAVVETSGTAAATFALYDGDGANGRLLTEYTLSAGQSTSDSPMLHQLQFEQGLYVDQVNGSLAGTITAWADHDCGRWLEAEHAYYELVGEAVVSQIAALAG